MARLDQRLQILGPAVGGSGRKELHAVIAPVAPPRKLRDRHQLDRGHAERDEIVEPRDRAGEIAALGERAEMQLVDDHLFPAPAAPAGIGPAIGAGIDDLAGAVHAVRLIARGGVGVVAAVDAVAIARTGRRRGRSSPTTTRPAPAASGPVPPRSRRAPAPRLPRAAPIAGSAHPAAHPPGRSRRRTAADGAAASPVLLGCGVLRSAAIAAIVAGSSRGTEAVPRRACDGGVGARLMNSAKECARSGYASPGFQIRPGSARPVGSAVSTSASQTSGVGSFGK